MTWATGNAATATVDANGLVTGRAGGGPVTISATAEGVTGTSAITVVAFVPVASVDVTPAAATILASGSSSAHGDASRRNGKRADGTGRDVVEQRAGRRGGLTAAASSPGWQSVWRTSRPPARGLSAVQRLRCRPPRVPR